MTEEYTAVSFAPVQGFIEKSRKLRDLYGASLILSYLSSRIVQEALCLGLEVISPGLPNVQKGMPNRILIKGKFERNDVQNILLKEWQKILTICRDWIEDNLGIPKDQYCWSQPEDQKGKHKGEWERWGSHTWEIFWGYGASIPDAMEDLETRKLKRDWTGINWIGESSSLTGTDAIAWHQLGKESNQPGQALTSDQKDQLELFYRRLSWLLDNPEDRLQKSSLSLQALREYEEKNPDTSGKYIAPNERLSIPELVKRLVTYDKIADQIGMAKIKQKSSDPEFKEINRNAGYWTGWFMGDGDEVGDKLQLLATQSEDHMRKFTNKMREWGKEFEKKQNLFPEGKGRVIYAGGDDFLGVLYSEQTDQNPTSNKLNRMEVLNWLLTLPEHWQELQEHWQELQTTLDNELQSKFTFSVGFVWAGHQVPQRDVLQHCREAEKRSKNLGRDRLTIRVVFNSGQFVQWTCPWKDLDILKKYRDRNGKTWGENPNWTHIYNDWEQLKARHAIICLRGASKQSLGEISKKTINKDMALALFNLYFDEAGKQFKEEKKWNEITKNNTDIEILSWLNDLVQVGWQLCHNSNI